MYYCSKNSKEKIAHTENCQYAKRIQPRNTIMYKNAIEARNAGYRVCKCCAPIKTYVKKQDKEIDQYCQQAGLSCQIDWREGCLKVATSYSQWKIIVNGRDDYIFLYHKNFHRFGINNDDLVPGYHSQKTRKSDILGYLEYVAAHDSYRISNPIQGKAFQPAESHPRKGSKKFRAQERRQKNREKRRSVARVLDLIEAIHNEQGYRQAVMI